MSKAYDGDGNVVRPEDVLDDADLLDHYKQKQERRPKYTGWVMPPDPWEEPECKE